jgi:hypothetical protein
MTSPARRPVTSVISAIALPATAATGLFVVYCILLAVSSSPRRVGDGVEYWAMAEQMRTGRRPAATRAELARLEREAGAIGGGFDQSPLRFPQLVAADGRQDFPHFWLYPLVNVPALALVRAAGVHPNWAFTLTNITLLALAFAIVARRVSVAWAALLLGGPLIWWIDKAHGDVFTVTLLAVACALWQTMPAWTVVVVALAAAQNPALMPVWALTCVAALWRQRRQEQRQVAAAVAVSALIVALPLAYYKSRLGVWSPLIGYTHPTWPSIRAVLSLLADPNVGLLANAPCVVAAGLWVIAARARDREGRAFARSRWGWLLAAAACVLMLAAFAQSVNLNHGSTPGMNRWTLWLLPWLLLIVRSPAGDDAGRRNGGAAGARVLAGLAVLNVLWGVWFFRPALPEVYRYPTMTATWLWMNAPGWYAPAPEIFAERVSHREPAPLPVAWPGCTKVLLVNGRWPASCVPTAPAPADCLGADRLCYATPSTTSTIFTPLGDVSFPWVPAARSWPGNAPFVAALRAELTLAGAQEPGGLQPAETIVRAAHGVGRTSAWSGRSQLVIYVYVEDASPAASLDVRLDAEYRGQLIDLDTRTALASLIVARSGEQPSVLALPAAVQHGLIRLERAR